MNLDTLEALAKAVPKDICFQNIHHLKAFNAAANPETILTLIALLREMGECLLHCYAETDARINKRAAVLAKFKEMTNGN